jgi:hypothetical protein
MRKILVVGGDIDVIRVLQDRLPDHKIVAVTEREARKQVLLVDEHACPVGDFFAELCRPMSINEINNIIIHESLELEAYQRQSFDLRVKPNPAARHYHKFTQPYGKDHRNGRRC